MSELLNKLEPFMENMNEFIRLYRNFDVILDGIHSPPGFGMSVTQEEYYHAAENLGVDPGQAEYLKLDFVEICRKLIDDENEPGSIKRLLVIMSDENQFDFYSSSDLVMDEYAEKQYQFEIGLNALLSDNLNNFILDVDSPDLVDGVFDGVGDIDPDAVEHAINSYEDFIRFLIRESRRENLESIAGGMLTRRLQRTKKRKGTKKRSTRVKRKRAKKRSTRVKRKRAKKHKGKK
jgi:hypothetical protein